MKHKPNFRIPKSPAPPQYADALTLLAHDLIHQMDNPKETGYAVAFWAASSIWKLTLANPNMPISDLFKIIQEEMPNTTKELADYLANT